MQRMKILCGTAYPGSLDKAVNEWIANEEPNIISMSVCFDHPQSAYAYIIYEPKATPQRPPSPRDRSIVI